MMNLHGKVVDEGEGAILSFKKKKKKNRWEDRASYIFICHG